MNCKWNTKFKAAYTTILGDELLLDETLETHALMQRKH